MIALAAAITLAALIVAWALGEGVARLVFGPRHAAVAPELRPLLGVAVMTLLLELFGYGLPVRIAAWIPLALSLPGLRLLARPGSSLRRDLRVSGAFLFAALLGLAPLVVVGRFTAASMTNNDATFYLAAADRLTDAPWGVDLAAAPDSCLRERLLRGWYWRTGTSNLVAALSVSTRLPPTRVIAVVTALLLAVVPAPSIAFLRSAKTAVAPNRRAVAGVVAASSAAAVFLAYQHLLGQLAAYALFPCAIAAVGSAVRAGGRSRIVVASVLVGASVAHFADAASVLLVLSLVVAFLSRRPATLVARRLLAMAGVTLLVAPLTVARAAIAAFRTVTVRAQAAGPLFPQRGWIPKILPDHLVTVTGVDPWPPWPTAWPPSVATVLAIVGTGCGTTLLILGIRRRRLREVVLAVVVAAALVTAAVVVKTPYVVGKAMLLGAAFATPVIATSVASVRGAGRFLGLGFVVAELGSVLQFLSPARWTVVDTEAHDRLVPVLSTLPRGSLLALDGFGAPADAVLDEHRAFRAAQLAGLLPISAGLDGGFYRPRCADPPRPSPLPVHAYAVQRVTSETVSVGTELARFGPFRVLEANLAGDANWVGIFAPKAGFLRSEFETGAGPFRWSEATSTAALRVVSRAACATLRGELRTAGSEGLVTIASSGEPLYGAFASPKWTSFTTSPLDVRTERSIETRFEPTGSVAPPDDAHAIAYRRLSVSPDSTCVRLLGEDVHEPEVTMPILLSTEVHVHLAPAVGLACGRIRLGIAGAANSELGVSIDGGAVDFHLLTSDPALVDTDVIRFSRAPGLGLLRRGGKNPTVSITTLTVEPAPCPP